MKKFIYLVQSEENIKKLSKQLPTSDSDVIFLTWERPVNNAIFFPLSTWAEARNRLYQEVFNTNYLYYIFVDGDADLKFTELSKNTKKSPWRVFENYLLKFLPAFGTPRFFWNKQVSEEVQTVYHYDATINAIHREALNVLLPIYDGDDMESWWNSGIYFLHLTSMLYRNHVFQFNTVEVVNRAHRIYPRHYDWEKIDYKFKTSILSNKLTSNFQPHNPLSQSSNGTVKKKSVSYAYTKEALSNFFDFNNPIFKRRLAIQDNIANDKTYAVCDHSKLPYWGQHIHKNWGTKTAMLLFGPLLILYELRKRYLQHSKEFKQNVCSIIWFLLRITRPLRHRFKLRKIKKDKTPIEKIDRIIKRYASHRKNFFFISIGSNNGRGDLIYRYVKQYKYHWKGILIEPVPYIFERLKNTYKGFGGLIFENVAIDKKDRYKTFYRIEENFEPDNPFWYDQLGTFKKEVIQKHRNEVPNFDKHLIKERIKCISLRTLFRKHLVSKIDLLHMDVEGYDYEIIRQIPFNIIRPQMIFYENRHLSQRDADQCMSFLESQGYKLLKMEGDTFAY